MPIFDNIFTLGKHISENYCERGHIKHPEKYAKKDIIGYCDECLIYCDYDQALRCREKYKK